MNIKTLKTGAMTLLLILSSTVIWAQSPAATAKGTINGANITVDYSSPSVKGRKIYGALVPYNEVWRAGANDATVFKTDKKIVVGSTPLPAGSYSIYAIPTEKTWTIIFNSETGQWGTGKGGTTRVASKDVLRVVVKPVKPASLVESLKYEVTPKGLLLAWENQSVLVPIK